ncbi:MAG: hypothetical protein Q4G33_14135 [bacterium]|nr:hypothetical protein [bacterium]
MYNHKNHSKVFKCWYIALVIIIFIIGIVAGFAFKIEPTPSLYSLYSSKPKFNWLLAVIIWLSEVIPITILYAVYSHLENQEIQINLLNVLRENTAAKTTDNATGYISANNVSVMRKLDEENNFLRCPNCGKSNPVGTKRCINCHSIII